MGEIMETHSGEAKPGRYDCPACGKRIFGNLDLKGTFFHPTYHCPHCGAHLSHALYLLVCWGAVILLNGIWIIEMTYQYGPRWSKVLIWVPGVAFLLFAVFILIRTIVEGPYRLIPDQTEKTQHCK